MTLADKIVVLHGGVIEQVGTPLELYHHPEQPVRRRLHRLAEDELRAGDREIRVDDVGATVTSAGRRRGHGSGRSRQHRAPGTSVDPWRAAGASAALGGDGQLAGEVLVVERLGGETFLYVHVARRNCSIVAGRRRQSRAGPRARGGHAEARHAPPVRRATGWRSQPSDRHPLADLRRPTAKALRTRPMYLEKYRSQGPHRRRHRRRPGDRPGLRGGAGRGRAPRSSSPICCRARVGSGRPSSKGKGHDVDEVALDVTKSGRGRRVADDLIAKRAWRRRHPGQQCRHRRSATSAPRTSTDEHWRFHMDVNLDGAVLVLPRLRPAHARSAASGSIVNIGSMSGFIVNKPQPQSYYNASKAACII